MGTVTQGRLARLRRRLAGFGRRLLVALPGPLRTPAQHATELVIALRAKAAGDDVPTYASALAFAAFLSLFPLLLLALAVTAYVADLETLVRELIEIVPGLGAVVTDSVAAIGDNRAGLGVLGVLGALWSASALATRTGVSLGVIFDTSGGALALRARSLLSTVALGILLLATIAAYGVLANTAVVQDWPAIGGALMVTALLGLQFVFFAAAYAALTPGGVPWRVHLPGAALGAVAFLLVLTIGNVLVSRVIVRSTGLYGTIGVLFGLLLFFRLVSSVFLLGAELSSILRRRATPPQR